MSKVSKVIYGNTTVIDITDSTVNANNLLSGNKAYGADGEPVFGALTVGSTINVTTSDSSLFGETLTLSKGQTTLTTTFDNSGDATFTSVLLTGTLTLSCAGFSMTISVPSYDTYNVVFSTVPQGSVVTPTDDIQIWLACADIKDKAYTTLAEVLADRETFETLIADSNACDYMARSTTWAGNNGVTYNETAMALIGKYDYCCNALLCNATWVSAIANSDYIEEVLNVKVPKMTSNTTPSGTCFSHGASNPAYYAFDENDSTYWSASDAVDGYIGYQFPKVTCVRKAKFRALYGNRQFTVAYSDDNSTWVECSETVTATSASTDYYVTTTEKNFHRYWRLNVHHTQGASGFFVQTVQFYGRAEKAIYSPKVPTMTSDTQPSGEAVGSTADSGLQLYRMFNKNSMDCYSTAPNTPTTGFYAGYKFDTATVINKLSIMTTFWHTNSSSAYYDLGIYGGDSLDNLTKLSTTNLRFTSTTSLTAQTTQKLTFENDTAYLYYVLKFESASSGIDYMKVQSTYAFMIWELQFYSKASATNLVHSCGNDTLYYYDSNDTAVTLCTTDENGDGIIDYGSLDAGYYTIYSTVAKDPSNLANPYTKTIRITSTYYGHTTEAYIMPDAVKTLYWWGYEGSDLEDVSTANGWGGNRTNYAPVHNTNGISFSAGELGASLVGLKTTVRNKSFKFIGNQTGGGNLGYCATYRSSKSNADNVIVSYISYTAMNTLELITMPSQANEYYFTIGFIAVSRTGNLNALWYE